MAEVLYHSIFQTNQWGHGGEKRTAQLAEIFSEAKVNRVVYHFDKTRSRISIAALVKSFFAIFCTFKLDQFKSSRALLRYWKSIFLENDSLEKFFDSKEAVFIWESTKDYFYHFPYYAGKSNKKIIALPHNLESLVPFQKSVLSGKASPQDFLSEIKILKKCHAVFTISREETLFLSLFGVNASYLPYYPTQDVERFLLSIRRCREVKSCTKINQILMLGSAINPPTEIGMKDRLHFFKQNNLQDLTLRIAGYGTEVFRPIIGDTKNVQLIGELSIKQLEQELLKTDVLLICQPASSGAVTRIIEFLIAGIPVLVNSESARSYFGFDGLLIYENDEQLIGLLQEPLKTPKLPLKPYSSYNRFVNTVFESID